jgi:hypothetical protein
LGFEQSRTVVDCSQEHRQENRGTEMDLQTVVLATLYAKRHGLDDIKTGYYTRIVYRMGQEFKDLSVDEIGIILKMVHVESQEND